MVSAGRRACWATFIALLALSLLPVGEGTPAGYEVHGFIRTCKGKLVDQNGRQFLFSGWNGYISLLQDAYDYLYSGGPDLVTHQFQQAKAAGLTAARVWGMGEGTALKLQAGPNSYNEPVFRALDYVVWKARQFNIRLIMNLGNFWQDWDGIIMYCRFAGLTYPIPSWGTNSPYYTEQWAAKDQFWTNAKTIKLFKQHIHAMMQRRNTFNGLLYKNDYAIMGYDLFNEHRCPAAQNGQGSAACVQNVANWANQMVLYAKTINKKQLFTMGEEGFFASTAPWEAAHPGFAEKCNPNGVPDNVQGGWAATVGQDFDLQHRHMDFMSFHLWPDNWATPDPNFAITWIRCHVQICASQNKPCVLEEFGIQLSGTYFDTNQMAQVRDPYFETVYLEVQHQVKSNSNLAGSMWWQWLHDFDTYFIPDGIRVFDSTFQKIIKPHARWMKKKAGKPLCGKKKY